MAATENVPRVRVTTRSLRPRACPARVEAVPTATVPVVRVPQPAPAVPVPVVRVPQQVPVAPVRVLRVPRVHQALAVPRVPAETVLLRA